MSGQSCQLESEKAIKLFLVLRLACLKRSVTGRSTGAYIIFYQGGPIDHGTHVPVPVAQSSAESEYNSACTAGMALSHFRMLVHELLNEDP